MLSDSVSALQMAAVRLAQNVGRIEAVVELYVQMVGLEAQDRPQRRHVGREAPVPGVEIVAIGDGRLYRRFGGSLRRGSDLRGIAPGAILAASSIDALRPELEIDDGAHSGL